MAAPADDIDAPKTAADAMIGSTINGRYRVRSVIANGGMGRIYLSEQIPLGRLVALKVLHGRYTTRGDDPAFQKRFLLEASILSRLQHPNIVTLYDYGRIEGGADDNYFMAMEYLAGDTLHRRLRDRGALSPAETTQVARGIARGLREAHRQGVVHRDLKPSNVMLVPAEDGQEIVKILDFGLVKVLSDDSEELTKEGSFLGSPRYMSPEQIAHGRVDLRTDVYSLGVMLYQCLCGHTPFESENSVHILMAHINAPVPPMRLRAPQIEVPERLERFVLRCLEKDPERRPATVEDFLRELTEVENALGIVAVGLTTGAFIHGNLGLAPAPERSAVDSATVSQVSAARPGTLPENPPRAVLPLAMGVLVLAIAAAIGAFAWRRPREAVPAPSVVAPSFTLVLEAVPAGATVYEGETAIGRAPLALNIDPSSVQGAPRVFEVRAAGHRAATLRVGPSNQREVHRLVELTPLAPEVDAAAAVPLPPTTLPTIAPPPRVPRLPRRPTTWSPSVPRAHQDDIRTHR